VNKANGTWQVYRSKFLIQAKQLSQPLAFVDVLGREQRGDKGDYLVESSGALRIWPRRLFEGSHALLDSAPHPEELVAAAERIIGGADGAARPPKTRGNGKMPPARCGKAVPQPGTRAANCLRYNI
jgi:hypothetical protein